MERSKSINDVITVSGGSVVLDVAGMVQSAIHITGTWVATLQFEGTINEDDWFSVDTTPIPSSTAVTNTTATGKWVVLTPGYSKIRVRCSAYTSGRAKVAMRATAGGESMGFQKDANGNINVNQATLSAGEDLTNDVQKVEQRYTPLLLTVDTLVKTGTGFLHTLTFSCNDAAPTAGSIIVYDNTAESGTQLFNHTFTTTPFAPCSVTIDGTFSTGLYVGFTTTTDVNVTVSYR
jgi:hypothetical protein